MLHRYWLSVCCRFYRVNNDEGKKYKNDNELDLKTCRGWARGLALHRDPFHNSTSRKCFYHISCKNAVCSVIWDTQSQRFCSVIIHTGSKWAARVTPSNSSELWFWFYYQTLRLLLHSVFVPQAPEHMQSYRVWLIKTFATGASSSPQSFQKVKKSSIHISEKHRVIPSTFLKISVCKTRGKNKHAGPNAGKTNLISE